MGRAYGAKEFECRMGIRDVSSTALGTQVSTDSHTLTPFIWRLNSLNDISFDGGVQQSMVNRSGSRVMRAEDIITKNGAGGGFTWDFDWLVDNEQGMQNLMKLIYPQSWSSGVTTIPASPLVDPMAHGQQGAIDSVADIVINTPTADDEDRMMHSAVLQNLTIQMDAGTNGGLMNVNGQFMTGYKIGIGDYDALVSNSESTASDYAKGLFDFTTTTVNSVASSVRSFSLTIENSATRVGYQGTSGETDGYSRAGEFSITGSITVKADDNAMNHLTTFLAGSPIPLALNDGTANWDFSLPNVVFTGNNMDMADDGVFVELPFKATSGEDAGANLAVIKIT